MGNRKKSASHPSSEPDKAELSVGSRAEPGEGKGSRHVIKMVDNFSLAGPNGLHVCIVLELLGPNLLSLIFGNDYKGLPVSDVKAIIRQVSN